MDDTAPRARRARRTAITSSAPDVTAARSGFSIRLDSGEISPLTGSGRDHSAGVTLKSLPTACTEVLSGLADPPILIGHGLGAVFAQVLLDHRGTAGAAIALSPGTCRVGSQDRPAPVGRTAFTVGSVGWPPGSRISPAASAHAYANTRPATEAADLYRRYVIPGSSRPLLQVAYTLREPAKSKVTVDRPRLLIVSDGKDRLTPETTARSWERYGRRRHPDSVTDHHCSLTAVIPWIVGAGAAGGGLTGPDPAAPPAMLGRRPGAASSAVPGAGRVAPVLPARHDSCPFLELLRGVGVCYATARPRGPAGRTRRCRSGHPHRRVQGRTRVDGPAFCRGGHDDDGRVRFKISNRQRFTWQRRSVRGGSTDIRVALAGTTRPRRRCRAGSPPRSQRSR